MSLIPEGWEPTIAEKIVHKLMDDVKAMLRSDDASPLFKNVERGDPDDKPEIKPLTTPACYVEDSDDTIDATLYTQDVLAREISLIVHVRFAKGQQGVDPYTVFQYYRGELTKLFGQPNYIRPLGIIMYEVGYSPEIFQAAGLQGGNIVFRVKYRHERPNPYVAR